MVYKALDNMGVFPTVFGVQPDARVAVLGFGLAHGFGLATKLQAFTLPANGLVTNIVSFNVGVEIGQVVALVGRVRAAHRLAHPAQSIVRHAFATNTLLMAAGFLLVGYQLSGYFLES